MNLTNIIAGAVIALNPLPATDTIAEGEFVCNKKITITENLSCKEIGNMQKENTGGIKFFGRSYRQILKGEAEKENCFLEENKEKVEAKKENEGESSLEENKKPEKSPNERIVSSFSLRTKKERDERPSNQYFFYAGQFFDEHFFQGIGFEASNKDRSYSFNVGFFKTDTYIVKEKSEDHSPEGPINSLVTNLPKNIEIKEELRRQDYLGLINMNYSLFRYTLNPDYIDNLQIMADTRATIGIGLHAYNQWRKYNFIIDQEKRSITNPSEKTITRGEIYIGLSSFLKAGIGRMQYDFQADFVDWGNFEKYGLIFQRYRHILSYGIEL